MRKFWLVAAAATLSLCSGGAWAATPAERALRNLELLRSGAKEVGGLSDAEKRELVAAERLERGGKSKERPTARQRCIDDEVKREGGSPSELTLRVIDLKCSQR